MTAAVIGDAFIDIIVPAYRVMRGEIEEHGINRLRQIS